jgi:hypothetical protein
MQAMKNAADEFDESETAVAMVNSHLLDQISDRGLYKSTPPVAGEMPKAIPPKIKQRLNVTVAISDIMNIDPMNESFSIKYRMYVFWEINLHAIGLRHLAEKALQTGHFYSLTRSEIESLEEEYSIPNISLFNEISNEETDPFDVRVYGGKEGMTAVLWNKLYHSTCRERFDLQDFPFDCQDLVLDFRLNDPKTWDDFNLTINTVQFHKDALKLSEWKMYAPIVKRDSPKEKATKVLLLVKRFSGFYLQNIVAMMFGLTMLGLLAFAMDVADLGSRVSTILTLILTVVAFKFILASTLPKVPYNCLIDYFMMTQMAALGMMALFCILPNFFAVDIGKSLNLALALLSCFFIVSSLLSWLLYAKYCVNDVQSRNVKAVPLVPNKNWYSYRYSSPAFLTDIDQATDLGGLRKLAKAQFGKK